jgi:hypothetical protein
MAPIGGGMIFKTLAVAVMLVLSAAAHAETLRCEFSKGVINSEDRHHPGAGAGYVRRGWKSPESVGGLPEKAPELTFTLKFTPGDATATLAGNNAIVTVNVVTAQWFRSFVEITPGNGVHVLTVDVARGDAGKYLAAYSRHAVVADSLIVSQFWGYCR